MIEPIPCPFCGENLHLRIIQPYHRLGIQLKVSCMLCQNCGAQGPHHEMDCSKAGSLEGEFEETMKLWAMRPRPVSK